MADTDKQNRYRGLKPYRPGQSGNPAGRPKGATITTYLRAEAEKLDGDRTKGEKLAEVAFNMALSGDMRAIDYVTQRLDGKVPDRVINETENQSKPRLDLPYVDSRFSSNGNGNGNGKH